MNPEQFIARWQHASGSELANAQSFVRELTELLELPPPNPAQEKAIHEIGLVSVLKTLHDELDAAVLDAYGWADLVPQLATEAGRAGMGEVLLSRLVALNLERAREEVAGQIRWLRPEYQNAAEHLSHGDSLRSQKNPTNATLVGDNPDNTPVTEPKDAPQTVTRGEGNGGQRLPTEGSPHGMAEGRLEAPAAPLAAPPKRKKPATEEPDNDSENTSSAVGNLSTVIAAAKKPWPTSLPEQMAAVAQALTEAGVPLTEPEIAARFTGKGAWKKRLPEILQTLVALGRARQNGSH